MDVTWDAKICQHAGICVKTLPQVFRVTPTGLAIDTNQASEAEIREVVGRCPSGALQIHEEI
jgi:uncharacterized Fe-S cluster protein YjdI